MIKVERLDGTADLSIPFQIREEVFIKEQAVPEVEEFDGFDQESVHYIIYLDEDPVATSRWRQTDDGVKLERFAVLPTSRRKGLAGLLVEISINDIRKLFPYVRIYLHAQTEVKGLYSKYGFSPIGEEFMECDILHQTISSSTPYGAPF